MKKNNAKITYLSRPGEELESVVERALVLSVASGDEVVSSECDSEVVRYIRKLAYYSADYFSILDYNAKKMAHEGLEQLESPRPPAGIKPG